MYKIIYVVHSEINEAENYIELEDKEEALDQARAIIQDKPYIVAVDLELDDFGRTIGVNEEETIWSWKDELDEDLDYDYIEDANADMQFAEADEWEELERLSREANEAEYEANCGPDWYDTFEDEPKDSNEQDQAVKEGVDICISVDDDEALDIVEWPDEFAPRMRYDVEKANPFAELEETEPEACVDCEEPIAEPESTEIVMTAEVPAEMANEIKGDEEVKVEIPAEEVKADADIITAEDTSDDDSAIEDIEIEAKEEDAAEEDDKLNEDLEGADTEAALEDAIAICDDLLNDNSEELQESPEQAPSWSERERLRKELGRKGSAWTNIHKYNKDPLYTREINYRRARLTDLKLEVAKLEKLLTSIIDIYGENSSQAEEIRQQIKNKEAYIQRNTDELEHERALAQDDFARSRYADAPFHGRLEKYRELANRLYYAVRALGFAERSHVKKVKPSTEQEIIKCQNKVDKLIADLEEAQKKLADAERRRNPEEITKIQAELKNQHEESINQCKLKLEQIKDEIAQVKDPNYKEDVNESKDVPVVKCPVNDVITHSEDEKPLDCEMNKKPLDKPLTESADRQALTAELKNSEEFKANWIKEVNKLDGIIDAFSDDGSDRVRILDKTGSEWCCYSDSPWGNREEEEWRADTDEEAFNELFDYCGDEFLQNMHDKYCSGTSIKESVESDMDAWFKEECGLRGLDYEFRSEFDFGIDEVSCSVYFDKDKNKICAGVVTYHASEDNNAENPDRHTDEDDYTYDTMEEFMNDADMPDEFIEFVQEQYDEYVNDIANESLEEDTHAKEAKPEFNNKAGFNKALKLAKENDADVIYGYEGSDKHGGYRYFEIEPIICKNMTELRTATNEVMAKYHPSGSVLVAYKNKDYAESFNGDDDMTDEELAEELWKAHCEKAGK